MEKVGFEPAMTLGYTKLLSKKQMSVKKKVVWGRYIQQLSRIRTEMSVWMNYSSALQYLAIFAQY